MHTQTAHRRNSPGFNGGDIDTSDFAVPRRLLRDDLAGAAIYINITEHPAHMPGNTHAATAQWAHSYRRATFMQAPLALISLIAGIAAWLFGAGAWWLIAAVLVGAVVPFTFIAIMPTNYELLSSDRDLASVATGRLLERWARLHAVRSTLSLVASVLFLWQLAET
jgi:Domain of unknown function (DUF1772)